MAGLLLFATVPESSINSWDSWFIFNLRKNKQLLSYRHNLHTKKRQWLLVTVGRYVVAREQLFALQNNIYRQCTYLNIGLLEAPREYVLHGPLLGIYWTQHCPHSGKRVSCCHACPEDTVYGSDSSFTQCLFALWVASRWCTSEQHSTHVQYTAPIHTTVHDT